MVGFEGHELRNVKVRAAQQVELASQIEVKQTLGGAVRRDDSVAHPGNFRFVLQFGPLLVAATALASGNRQRNPAARGGGILAAGLENGVRDVLRLHGRQFLAVVFVEIEGKADSAQRNSDAFIRVIAKGDADGDDARIQGRFLVEFLLVLLGRGPGFGGDRQPFVSVENGATRGRARLLRASRDRGDEQESGGSEEGGVSHPDIINFLHLDAFDSWGKRRVALCPAAPWVGGAGTKRSHVSCISSTAY